MVVDIVDDVEGCNVRDRLRGKGEVMVAAGKESWNSDKARS